MEATLVVLDVETTGLSPDMGDRVVELGMITCQGATEISRSSHLVNPGRPIPRDAQQVHGISDQDVSECPPFKEITEEVESTLIDSWIVGHNVRFETIAIAMVGTAVSSNTLLGFVIHALDHGTVPSRLSKSLARRIGPGSHPSPCRSVGV